MRWVILLLAVVLNASANLLIKSGMAAFTASGGTSALPRALLQPALLGGLACFGLALGAYSAALTRFELSVAYPLLTSLGLLIVLAVSVMAFNESFTWAKLAGTGLVIAGIVLLSRGS